MSIKEEVSRLLQLGLLDCEDEPCEISRTTSPMTQFHIFINTAVRISELITIKNISDHWVETLGSNMHNLTEAVRKFCGNVLNNLHSPLNALKMMQSLMKTGSTTAETVKLQSQVNIIKILLKVLTMTPCLLMAFCHHAQCHIVDGC